MTISIPTQFIKWLRVLGLAVSLYLGLMKLAALPCGLGAGCDGVLSSRYAVLFGVPTGFYGACVWALALLSPSPLWRRRAQHVLGFGSIVLVGLQVFVLHRYCAWCLAHAVIAWLAWPGWRVSTRSIHLVVGLALAVGGHVVQRAYVSSRLPAHAARSFEDLRGAGLDWLGPVDGDSPVLVLSLRCASCWDRWLDPLGSQAWRPRKGAPQVLWKTEAEEGELTAQFLAAVLSRQGGRSEAFATVLAQIREQRDAILDRPEQASAGLAIAFPGASAHLAEAHAILDKQVSTLSAAGLKATPLWIERGLPPSADSAFSTDMPEGRSPP